MHATIPALPHGIHQVLRTGINLGEKKNYVGTFYRASEVLIDPLFLDKLPKEEFRNGVAEIVKYGIVFGTPSLERLAKGVFPDDDKYNSDSPNL